MFDDETKKILDELKLSSLVDELERVSKSKEGSHIPPLELPPLQPKVVEAAPLRPRMEEKKDLPNYSASHIPSSSQHQSSLKSLGILVAGLVIGICLAAFLFDGSSEIAEPPPQVVAIADCIDCSSADFGPEHQELVDILQERKEVLSEITQKMRDLVDRPHESTQLVHELVEYVQDFSRLNDCYMDEIRDKIVAVETMLEGNDKLLRRFQKQLVQLKIR